LPFGRGRFWGNERVCGLQAYACLNCGLVKLYTDDVTALREATSQHPEWFRW
jgi:hypothetical protein